MLEKGAPDRRQAITLMLAYSQLDYYKKSSVKFNPNTKILF